MRTLSNFYQSKEWVGLMAMIKAGRTNAKGFNICEHCGKPIVRSYDCIGHHKIHLTAENINDVTISLNPENVALVHHRCHNLIHKKFSFQYKEVYLVYGAPLSGKSTYVNEVMLAGDLIVDMDAIWECVSGCEHYVKPKRLNAVVFGVRDYLIDCIKYRKGKWNTAYIVGGYPLISDRERLIKTLGAKEIFVECTQEECINRLEASPNGRNIADWKKYIDDWFEKSSIGVSPL